MPERQKNFFAQLSKVVQNVNNKSDKQADRDRISAVYMLYLIGGLFDKIGDKNRKTPLIQYK